MKPVYLRMVNRMDEKARAKKRRSRKEPWFLYVLECCDGSLYTGITKDLERRLKEHNAGRASRYTRAHRPVRMIYHEPCRDRTAALLREIAVKRLSREKKEALVGRIPPEP
jgi:predicted GIY-YIG superfamily endonuclease